MIKAIMQKVDLPAFDERDPRGWSFFKSGAVFLDESSTAVEVRAVFQDELAWHRALFYKRAASPAHL